MLVVGGMRGEGSDYALVGEGPTAVFASFHHGGELVFDDAGDDAGVLGGVCGDEFDCYWCAWGSWGQLGID